jgi:surface antigen
MEAMKLFRAIIILSSILFTTSCGANLQTVKETQGTFVEFPQPVMLGENQLWSLPGMLWNNIQFMRFTLNDEEKKMHQSAVYHALNNSKNGEITSWHSRERLAQGKVRVIHSFPLSDGHCRVYQAHIELNGAARHWTNNACTRFYSKGEWLFLK